MGAKRDASVLTLLSEAKDMRDQRDELLAALRVVLGHSNCCCEYGIGNPMVSDHLPACKQARAAIAKAGGK